MSRYRIIDGKIKMEGRDVECSFTKTAVVLCDGRLALCCYDFNGEYELGDAFHENIIKLWRSKRYRDMRKVMRRKDFEICKEMCGEKRKPRK